MSSFTVVVKNAGPTQAVANGTVKTAGFDLLPLEVSPIIGAYRRMVRELAYGVCEMAPTTYILARHFGKQFTALPVFFSRKFHHGDLKVRSDSGIRVPHDLEGQRVGVRAYTVTTGVWVRGILQSEYGVDLANITWVTDDEEHVEEYRNPENVEVSADSLVAMLRDGRIQAALTGNAGIGRTGTPRTGWTAPVDQDATTINPLFPHPRILEADWYLRTGIYPIHGLVVVRNELLDENPKLAHSLYDAFEESKRIYLDTLEKTGPLTAEDHQVLANREIVGDPLPYGIEANRKSLEALVSFAVAQGILPTPVPVEELFVAGDESNASQ